MQIDREKHLETKCALEKRNLSFSKIARSLGLSHTTVLAVSIGRSRSKRVEAAIASALDKSPAEIWPDRYQMEEG